MLRALSKWLLNTDRLGASTTSLGSLFQCLTTLSKEMFPNVKSEPPLTQLWTIPMHLPCGYALVRAKAASLKPAGHTNVPFKAKHMVDLTLGNWYRTQYIAVSRHQPPKWLLGEDNLCFDEYALCLSLFSVPRVNGFLDGVLCFNPSCCTLRGRNFTGCAAGSWIRFTKTFYSTVL